MDSGETYDQLSLEDAGLAESALSPEVAGDGPLPAEVDPTGGTVRPLRVRRLWFKNFKGFANFEIGLGDFNVLAGANNSGKSTVLQGADLVFRLIELHREGDKLASGRNVAPALLPVAHLRDLWYGRRNREANKHVAATLGIEFETGVLVEFGIIGPFGAATSKLLRSSGLDAATLARLATRPAVWVPSSVGIVRDEEYRPAARRRGLIFAGRHNEVLRNLLLDLQEQRGAYEELQRLLATHFGGSLGDVHFDTALDQFVTATYAAPGVQHDLYSVGAGFLQVVQLLAFILARDPGVVLLDEPDAHLHSSLQRTVVDVLDDLSTKRSMQVVLSTHSKEIINYIDPSRLVLIEKGAARASAQDAAVTQLAILQSLGEIDNVDAYTLVRNKRCLFVEGSTDAPIIERLAARLGLPTFAGDDRVVIVPVGGANRFEHVEQLNVFERLLDAPIASFEIRDRDARTDAARSAEMAAAKRPLHVLELDCIESYLSNPAVIARVITKASAERGGSAAPSASEVETLMLEESEKLKDVSFDRASERYQQDRRRETGSFPAIPEANTAARELVDGNWIDLQARLRVLPGKRFLAAIRTRLTSEYGVSFGNPRILEELTDTEISDELGGVLRAVAETAGARRTSGA